MVAPQKTCTGLTRQGELASASAVRVAYGCCIGGVSTMLLALLLSSNVGAHHGGGGIGRNGSSALGLGYLGQGWLLRSQLQLDQWLMRIEEERSFRDPIAEDALWWWQQAQLTHAWASWGAMTMALPWAFRFAYGAKDQQGLGDLQVGVRLLPWSSDAHGMAALVSAQLTLPTGSSEPGFSTRSVVGHVATTFMIKVADWMLLQAEIAARLNVAARPQVALLYTFESRVALLDWLQPLLAVQGQSFVRSGEAVSLQALPSQQREAGDTVVILEPGLALYVQDAWALRGSAWVPLTTLRDFDWGSSLSLQWALPP